MQRPTKLKACKNVLLHTFTMHVHVALHVADGNIQVTVMKYIYRGPNRRKQAKVHIWVLIMHTHNIQHISRVHRQTHYTDTVIH